MANDIKHINQFYMWCQKILPLVYGDELSYYETLCKVRDKLNETIEVVNSIYNKIIGDVTQIVTDSENRLNGQMQELQNNVNSQLEQNRQEMLSTIKQIEDALNAQEQRVQEQLDQQNLLISQKIIDITNEVRTQINLLKSWVEQNNVLIYAYIDDEIKKVIDMIPSITSTQVNNPITGKLEPIQNTIDFMSAVFRIFANPVYEWDNYNYTTVSMFDNSGITVWDWDMFGWDWLGSGRDRVWAEPVQTMRNPFTGEWDYIKDVINSLFQFHRQDAYTTSQFDSSDVTVAIFDGSDITMYEYDTEGKNILS